MDLDDILKGEKEEPTNTVEKPEQKAEPEAEAPEVAEPEQKADRPRDEKGRFTKGEQEAEAEAEAEEPELKAEETEPPTVEEETKPEAPKPSKTPESGLVAAAKAERVKRQAAEQRARELEERLAQASRPPEPDPEKDPQGYAKYHEAERINERVNLTVELARDRHEDFTEVMGENMEKWAAAQQSDPTLYDRAVSQKNPGEWAYQYLKREQWFQKIGTDPEAYIQQQLEERQKEMEARLRKELQESQKQPVPPPSLASAGSTGRNPARQWDGPKPLTDIFGGR